VTPDTVVDGELSTQGWNRYSYVKNNPIVYKDPTGHISIDGLIERASNLVSGDGPYTNKQVAQNKAAEFDKEMTENYLIRQERHEDTILKRIGGRTRQVHPLCDVGNCIGSSNMMAMMSEGLLKNKSAFQGDKKYIDRFLEVMDVAPDHLYRGGRGAFNKDVANFSGSQNPNSDVISKLTNSEIGTGKKGNYEFSSVSKADAEKYLSNESNRGKIITANMRNTSDSHYNGHAIGIYYNPHSKQYRALDPICWSSYSIGKSLNETARAPQGYSFQINKTNILREKK
jgi:hypothetical protein